MPEASFGPTTTCQPEWSSRSPLITATYPGIIMLADPIVGMTYRQEYLKGEAEDMGTVIALGDSWASWITFPSFGVP